MSIDLLPTLCTGAQYFVMVTKVCRLPLLRNAGRDAVAFFGAGKGKESPSCHCVAVVALSVPFLPVVALSVRGYDAAFDNAGGNQKHEPNQAMLARGYRLAVLCLE